jgi:hypothetical protein
MIDELIRQLQNPDPDVRKRAIMALGKAKDPTALKALAVVVRGDPDPSLRELALKAGQYIRQQTKKTTRGPADKDLPTTGMLIRNPAKNESPAPSAPPLRRSERKALEANPAPPQKKVVRKLEETGELPETGALLGKIKPAAPSTLPKAAAPAPKAPSSLLSNLNDKAPAPPQRSASPFITDSDDEGEYSDVAPVETDDNPTFSFSFEDEAPAPPSAGGYTPSYGDEPDYSSDLSDDEPIEPLRAPPLFIEKEAPPKPDEPQPFIKGSSIVKGRKYNVSKDDEERARGYVNAALSMNLNGDNAKAMKNLTQAISLNPNLINDGFFSNVAASVTGLDGDAAAEMIINRNQRKAFTEKATKQQKNQRVEKHLSEAKTSTGADVGFGLGIYALISTIGPLFAVLVLKETLKNFLNDFVKNSHQLPAQLQDTQILFNSVAAISPLPIAIVSGITSVLSLLLQTAIIHFLAKMLGGVGTWSHLLNVLVSFFNKWYLILYVVFAATIGITFLSLFSPILLCFLIVMVILFFYILVQTAGKIGIAYDFGAAKGFVTLLISGIVVLLITGIVNSVLVNSLHLAF